MQHRPADCPQAQQLTWRRQQPAAAHQCHLRPRECTHTIYRIERKQSYHRSHGLAGCCPTAADCNSETQCITLEIDQSRRALRVTELHMRSTTKQMVLDAVCNLQMTHHPVALLLLLINMRLTGEIQRMHGQQPVVSTCTKRLHKPTFIAHSSIMINGAMMQSPPSDNLHIETQASTVCAAAVWGMPSKHACICLDSHDDHSRRPSARRVTAT